MTSPQPKPGYWLAARAACWVAVASSIFFLAGAITSFVVFSEGLSGNREMMVFLAGSVSTLGLFLSVMAVFAFGMAAARFSSYDMSEQEDFYAARSKSETPSPFQPRAGVSRETRRKEVVDPFHSANRLDSKVHHIDSRCPQGGDISRGDRRWGDGGYPLCRYCKYLSGG